MDRTELIRRAGGVLPADLLLTNARVVNVLTGEVLRQQVAIAEDRIVGVGDLDYQGDEVVDLDGAFVAPGLIDAHVHIESSMVTPREYARAVVPRGTTTVVSDPHEIANVHGLAGIRFMLDDSADSPLDVRVMASSCVPATWMETSGARLEAVDIAPLADHPRVPGLAEVMNFPGVIHADPSVIAKLDAFSDRVIDGHAPGVSGKPLCAYVSAGITSDHECTTLEEAREKIRLGMTVFIREGTGARNLDALLPLVTAANADRFCFCTDDRQPADLLDQGHIDHLVRRAILGGLDSVLAVRIATWNAARHFRLRDRGAITPGRRADLIVFDDLEAPRPRIVFSGGVLVARDGRVWDEGWPRRRTDASAVPSTAPEHEPEDEPAHLPPHALPQVPPQVPPQTPPQTPPQGLPQALPNLPRGMHIAWDRVDLRVPARIGRVRVIGVVPDQIVTQHRTAEPNVVNGLVMPDRSRDLLKIAVLERHRGSGSLGLGFVQGLGLQRGALASSIAHDHHNLVVVGADDASMWTALRRVAEMGGGLAAADGDEVLADVALPIAGLMSDRPVGEVRDQVDTAIGAAGKLGSPLHDPFMTMSFLALEVIPELKLTDVGLVDVAQFAVVPLWVDDQGPDTKSSA